MTPKKEEKRYIVRKYVFAKTAQEALRIEKKYAPDDIWVDEEWKKDNDVSSKKIGF